MLAPDAAPSHESKLKLLRDLRVSSIDVDDTLNLLFISDWVMKSRADRMVDGAIHAGGASENIKVICTGVISALLDVLLVRNRSSDKNLPYNSYCALKALLITR